MMRRQGISNRGKRLGRDSKWRAGCELATWCITRQVVVEQVICTGSTITIAERLIGQGVQVVEDWSYPRLLWICTLAITASRIAILRVVVVGPWLRIWMLDLVGRRNQWVSLRVVVVCRITGAQHNMVRPGSTHRRLVIVVADGIVISDELEIRGISRAHVVVSHGERTLVNWCGRNGPVVIARRLVHPGVQVMFAFVLLLPHLVETMDRITHIRIQVWNVFCDLVGPIGQICREARIGHVLRLALCICRVWLGKRLIRPGLLRTEAVGMRIDCLLLRSEMHLRPQITCAVNNLL